jgi:hypothetical protein
MKRTGLSHGSVHRLAARQSGRKKQPSTHRPRDGSEFGIAHRYGLSWSEGPTLLRSDLKDRPRVHDVRPLEVRTSHRTLCLDDDLQSAVRFILQDRHLPAAEQSVAEPESYRQIRPGLVGKLALKCRKLTL